MMTTELRDGMRVAFQSGFKTITRRFREWVAVEPPAIELRDGMRVEFVCGARPYGVRTITRQGENWVAIDEKGLVQLCDREVILQWIEDGSYCVVDEPSTTQSQPLPTDVKARKNVPLYSGLMRYFPDALCAVAELSRIGNEQHNPGTPLHWDRSKSGDELDAAARHLLEAGTCDADGVRHSAKHAWRALANLQKEIETERSAPSSLPPRKLTVSRELMLARLEDFERRLVPGVRGVPYTKTEISEIIALAREAVEETKR